MAKSHVLRLSFFLFIGILCAAIFTGQFLKFAGQPDLTVMGFINRADGLGRQSGELIDAFKKEMKISFVSTRKNKTKDIPKQYRKFVCNRYPKWGKVIVFEDLLWVPQQKNYEKITRSCCDSIKIAYSMWEATKIPGEWVIILNHYFDAVAVPSKFLVDVYKNSGVKIPIFELPLGLDLSEFLKKPLKKSCGTPMIFGNFSACGDRKNHVGLIRAFNQAFGNDPNVLLRINCRFGDSETRHAVTQEIALSNADNILFSEIPLGQKAYLEEFNQIDCYVSPSKGEGFSIQPREAMALGIPVIVTNNTGQSVICDSGLVKAVNSPHREPAIYPWRECYGYNFNCDIDELADSLKEVRENYDKYLSQGEKARNWAKQYQYENLKNLYLSMIQPKKIILGNEDALTENFLVTRSKTLFKKYKKKFPNAAFEEISIEPSEEKKMPLQYTTQKVIQEKKVPSSPDLTVMGFLKQSDGIGRQSIELIDAFKEVFKISFISTREDRSENLPKQLLADLNETSEKWGKVVIFEDILWNPEESCYKKILDCPKNSVKIAYSMWESTKIPSEWVIILNAHFDAVAVPSKFLIDVYKNSGVTIPIFEVPLGLDLSQWLQQPLKEKRQTPMVFGNFSACSDRKNQVALIRAFAMAFGNDPNVQLRINCRMGEKETRLAVTKEIADLNYSNIFFTEFSLSSEEYLREFQNIDCYVSPSKGEGFSIQPREAMALGIPVIATNNTGQSVLCDSGLVKTIPCSIEKPACYPWGGYYGKNFDCQVDDLARAMKEMRENYDFYLKQGQKCRNWVKRFHYTNLKKIYGSLIHPKKILLGEEDRVTEEYLMTRSRALYEKYKNNFQDCISESLYARLD